MDDSQIKKQKNTILQLYLVLVLVIIGGFVPHMAAQILSLIFFLALVIAVPVYGATAPAGSLLKSHMRYLNATIWWGSLFLFLSVLIMGYWVFQQSDQSSFYALFERVNAGVMVGESEIRAVFDDFMQTNMPLLIKASVICIGPPLFYMAYRIARAVPRAHRAHRMENEA